MQHSWVRLHERYRAKAITSVGVRQLGHEIRPKKTLLFVLIA
jgi:hypothetical protein